jgi:ribosome biogenesis GTPase / thiamine phosphate phosphatase
VGKSTLVNTLSGESLQATAGIREDDARGRHTTTSRQLIAMPGGAWLIDTPGMRELKIGAVERGLQAAFTDLSVLAQSCRFRDCSHQREQGCAIQRAVQAGTLDARRLDNFLKLEREAANAARSVRERRERERHFGRLSKAIQTHQRRRKRSE